LGFCNSTASLRSCPLEDPEVWLKLDSSGICLLPLTFSEVLKFSRSYTLVCILAVALGQEKRFGNSDSLGLTLYDSYELYVILSLWPSVSSL
jgi:hypothetical protein